MTTDNPVDHPLHGSHLPATLDGIVRIIITPPIPATERVLAAGSRLRIEHNDVVGVGPFVVAGVANVSRTEGHEPGSCREIPICLVLLAAVKHDMQLAGLPIAAIRRNVQPPIGCHAMIVRLINELALSEDDAPTAELTGVLRVQISVNPPQQLPGGIVITVIDERIIAGRA